MTRSVRIVLQVLIVLLCAGMLLAQAGGSGQKKKGGKQAAKGKPVNLDNVSYKNDVVPVFKSYCLPCHTEDRMNQSELYLDSYENLMRGGKHGPPVIPGKADSSNLVRKMSLNPPFGDPMPMKRKTKFPQDTLNILKAWINQGAKNN